MVASSCVSGCAWLAVGHVQVSPITHVPQSHTVERVARAGSFVALTHVPFRANVHEREFLLFLLVLPLAGSRLLGLGRRGSLRRGLRLRLGPGSNERVPVGLKLPRCEETWAVSSMVCVFAQYEIRKHAECLTPAGCRASTLLCSTPCWRGSCLEPCRTCSRTARIDFSNCSRVRGWEPTGYAPIISRGFFASTALPDFLRVISVDFYTTVRRFLFTQSFPTY